MEDRETPRMRKYGESKTTRIMMSSVPHVTSGSGLRKFQADGFLFDRVWQVHCRAQIHAFFYGVLCWGFSYKRLIVNGCFLNSKFGDCVEN